MTFSFTGLSKKLSFSTRKSVALLSVLLLSSGTVTVGQSHPDDPIPYLHFTKRFLENHSRVGVAAVAEGRVITYEDIRRELMPLLPQLQAQYPLRQDIDREAYKLATGIRQVLIDRILVKAEFDRNQFRIPDSYIDSRINEILITEFEGDRQRRYEYLKKRGQTFQEYREELLEKVVIEVMRGRMERSLAMISPVKIQEYYEKNKDDFREEERAKIAVIMFSPDQEETAESLMPAAQALYETLKEGADFAEVAKRFGRDPLGGTPGEARWYERDSLQPQMAEIAFALKEGEVSAPLLFANNVFIFKLLEKPSRETKPLSEVREQIERTLSSQYTQEALSAWIEELRSKAYVQLYDM